MLWCTLVWTRVILSFHTLFTWLHKAGAKNSFTYLTALLTPNRRKRVEELERKTEHIVLLKLKKKDDKIEVTSKVQGQWCLTFAHVACFVIITELQGLIDACGSTAGHCGSKKTLETQRTLCKRHFLVCRLVNARNVMLPYQPCQWKCMTLKYDIQTEEEC